jgi:outer membrane protein insertion porin family/translocation and assembly module TamA
VEPRLLSIFLIFGLAGCASVPQGRSAVSDVDVVGNENVDTKEITEAIVTRKSPRFLGLVRGLVYDFEIFNRFVLERDMARIERLYRARGYYDARVRASRVIRESDDSVRIEIVVEEGPVVVTRQAHIEGTSGLDEGLRTRIEEVVGTEMPLEQPFDEDRFERSEHAIKRTLTDAGYAFAEVEREAEVDVVHDEARCRYVVKPGALATFGEVAITGLGDLSEDAVRRTLDIDPGDDYSTAKLEDAQKAVLALGAFSSVVVTPDVEAARAKGTTVVPVRVSVEPAELHKVVLGGGVAIDALKSEVHLLGGWSSQNFLGGLRDFSIEARPGLVLHPLRINNWTAPSRPLPMGRVDARLEQPGLFEARTDGFFAPSFRVYPVLMRSDIAEDDAVMGYMEAIGTVGAERSLWRVYLSVRQHVQYAVPFAYLGELSPFVGPVLFTYPELVLALDLTDDRGNPHQGLWLGTEWQSAILGDAQDIKVVPEARGYVPMGPLTLVLRTSAGLMWPFNYGSTLEQQSRSPVGPQSEVEGRDLQLVFFRGFFAGGNKSNRGYPPRTIAPHAVVPLIAPSTAIASASCDEADMDRCAVPVGGLTLWEASVEVRYPITGPLSGGVFCDTADVAPAQMQFRLDHPHLSCGTGVRFVTPAGPIRLDLAYRIPGMQVLHEGRENQGDPGTIFGAPINISAGIGESF